MAKKARLGKGLDALFGSLDEVSQEGQHLAGLRTLEIDQIRPGRFQPRINIDETALLDLAASIKKQGVLQPVVVRETTAGSFELIAGERRWRASKLAGLNDIPAVVRKTSDETALALALIENIQREDLNPIEEAAGLKRLLEEFGMTHEQVAEGVGRSRAAVTNLLRILNLDPLVREHLEYGRLEMGHGRALLSLPQDKQASVAEIVIRQRFSVRQTEQLVRKQLSGARGKHPISSDKDADIKQLETELSESLGTTVNIDDKRGRGKLLIDYHNLDQLDGIIKKLKT
ncbi:MAG: chromosome partitioning protein ParB [Gammaproteobacteria bacterium]|nr:chromosome partitioning protein ParB [Gammaproteobacteria bacterium]|tara:strand:- start:5390 stop:6250 length:861 start_codon:yes stop_codon:yes gene_type:complete